VPPTTETFEVNFSGMAEITQVHRSKQPHRPHYIVQWAERRGLRQTDLADELGADKSSVSRWYRGATPALEWQEKLAALFHVEREALFRHPDEDWFARFFADKTAEQLERAKRMLEAAFPDEFKAKAG
jgi:transcriptional regulator with XRE-family HTH domain